MYFGLHPVLNIFCLSVCLSVRLSICLTAQLSMAQEKMVLGGAARNRMLIKGGSSFNALVRALKQDVVTGAAPTTTNNEKLMYEVDKVPPTPVFNVVLCMLHHAGNDTRVC